MQDFLAGFREWDREMSFAFVSMIAGAYAWVMTEKILVGIAVGIAMHATQAILYELLAARYGWHSLEIAKAFRTHVAPRLPHLGSRAQRA